MAVLRREEEMDQGGWGMLETSFGFGEGWREEEKMTYVNIGYLM